MISLLQEIFQYIEKQHKILVEVNALNAEGFKQFTAIRNKIACCLVQLQKSQKFGKENQDDVTKGGQQQNDKRSNLNQPSPIEYEITKESSANLSNETSPTSNDTDNLEEEESVFDARFFDDNATATPEKAATLPSSLNSGGSSMVANTEEKMEIVIVDDGKSKENFENQIPVSKPKTFKCGKCEEIFNTNLALQNHFVVTHTHDCKTRCKKFNSASDLKRHNKTHREKSLRCRVCSTAFPSISELVEHQNTVHSEELKFQCDVCQMRFKHRSNVRFHHAKHTGRKIHTCQFCQMQFFNKGELNKHAAKHAKEEKPYKCSKCELKFSREHTFKIHYLTHSEKQDIQCDICGKKFPYKSALIKHETVHTKEKPYECDICHKRCNVLSNLTRHKLIHTGVKEFQCDECGKQFLRKATLKTHKLYHEKLKQNHNDSS